MRYAVTILVLLVSMPAAAQDAVARRLEVLQEVPIPPEIPPGVDEITPLAQDQAAPYRGMLLETDTAIRWTNTLRWWPEAFRLRVSEFSDVVKALEDSHLERYRLAEESYQREIEGLRRDMRARAQELADALDRSVFDSPLFGFAVGVVVSGVIAGLIAALASAL